MFVVFLFIQPLRGFCVALPFCKSKKRTNRAIKFNSLPSPSQVGLANWWLFKVFLFASLSIVLGGEEEGKEKYSRGVVRPQNWISMFGPRFLPPWLRDVRETSCNRIYMRFPSITFRFSSRGEDLLLLRSLIHASGLVRTKRRTMRHIDDVNPRVGAARMENSNHGAENSVKNSNVRELRRENSGERVPDDYSSAESLKIEHHIVLFVVVVGRFGCMMFFLLESRVLQTNKKKTAKQSASKEEQKHRPSSMNPTQSLPSPIVSPFLPSLLVAISAGWDQMGTFPCAIYGALGQGWGTQW